MINSRLKRALPLIGFILLLPSLIWAEPKKLLVVTVTKGFRHSSIPTAEKVLSHLSGSSGDFVLDFARTDEELAAKTTIAALNEYDGAIFANTTGDLPLADREAFTLWIKSGKAFVGMHSATDTFPGFPGYIDMIGGQFQTHGAQATVEALVEDPCHPAVRHYAPSFEVHDEIYIMRNFYRGKVHGLLTQDKHPNSKLPGDYPISWCKNYGKGRVFYTSLGHREDVWENARYQQHILGGIQWALKLVEGDATPQDHTAFVTPEEHAEGFQPLFNGVDLTGWKLRHEDGIASWSAKNGMLINEIAKDSHGTDLVTEEKFMNFTVRYEYMISKGSNSGFYLRGRHELQIFDDFEAGQPSLHGNGAIYNHTPVSEFASLAPGAWQTAEATIQGNQVTLILNGKLVHDKVTIDRGTGGQLDNNVDQPGPIFIQGDHGPIALRNIRIKALP